MFQFAGFASRPYVFRSRYPQRGGLPHSDISGSKVACTSPKLFAACHVLHRLYAPRYPPNALKTFDLSTSRHAQKSDQICLLASPLSRHRLKALGGFAGAHIRGLRLSSHSLGRPLALPRLRLGTVPCRAAKNNPKTSPQQATNTSIKQPFITVI